MMCFLHTSIHNFSHPLVFRVMWSFLKDKLINLGHNKSMGIH